MKVCEISTVTAPAGLPVTVEQFIDHGRLNGLTIDRQPELIERELTAATERGEAFCRRSFMPRRLRALYGLDQDAWRSLYLYLPRGHVQQVYNVSNFDGPLDAATYTVHLEWAGVVLGFSPYEPLTIEWESGFADAASVPASIREGILEYATVLYEDRPGVRSARYAAEAGRGGLPMGVRDLWRPWQIELSG